MYKKLKNMLCEELEELVEKGELNTSNLDCVDKLTHSIKSLDTIMAMEDSECDDEYGYSGSRYRDSRYNGRSYSRRYDEGYSGRRHNREDGKSYMINRIAEMADGTSGEEREVLKSALNRLKNM